MKRLAALLRSRTVLYGIFFSLVGIGIVTRQLSLIHIIFLLPSVFFAIGSILTQKKKYGFTLFPALFFYYTSFLFYLFIINIVVLAVFLVVRKPQFDILSENFAILSRFNPGITYLSFFTDYLFSFLDTVLMYPLLYFFETISRPFESASPGLKLVFNYIGFGISILYLLFIPLFLLIFLHKSHRNVQVSKKNKINLLLLCGGLLAVLGFVGTSLLTIPQINSYAASKYASCAWMNAVPKDWNCYDTWKQDQRRLRAENPQNKNQFIEFRIGGKKEPLPVYCLDFFPLYKRVSTQFQHGRPITYACVTYDGVYSHVTWDQHDYSFEMIGHNIPRDLFLLNVKMGGNVRSEDAIFSKDSGYVYDEDIHYPYPGEVTIRDTFHLITREVDTKQATDNQIELLLDVSGMCVTGRDELKEQIELFLISRKTKQLIRYHTPIKIDNTASCRVTYRTSSSGSSYIFMPDDGYSRKEQFYLPDPGSYELWVKVNSLIQKLPETLLVK